MPASIRPARGWTGLSCLVVDCLQRLISSRFWFQLSRVSLRSLLVACFKLESDCLGGDVGCWFCQALQLSLRFCCVVSPFHSCCFKNSGTIKQSWF